MNRAARPPPVGVASGPRGSLFRKYLVAFGAVVAVPLGTWAAVNAWFTYEEHRAQLAEVQKGHAEAAALRITGFIREIEGQLGWATHLSWAGDTREQHRLDALRLLRQVPAITDLVLLDGTGREQLSVSRFALDRSEAGRDLSADRRFRDAMEHRVHYGAVYFRRETEPFMSLAVGGSRPELGAVIAEVNLKHIWEVVSRIRVGREGRAWVVDGTGRLIAHPDISLVLRNTTVPAALREAAAAGDADAAGRPPRRNVPGLQGEPVLLAKASAAPLDWQVFVELPRAEADAPLREALVRALLVTAGGLALALAFAFALASRMVDPIRRLTTGAARIGAGRLDERITIDSGDELEALGRQFNDMAGALEASYTNLERKVDERTRELAAANRAKSRFLAAASHDLRQPLHALNLFVAQLRTTADPVERERLAARIESAVGNMNELFDGLLDISKLDAGVVAPALAAFPVARLLERVEHTFAGEACERGLSLRVVPSDAWVLSDPTLLERIVFNLVSNALRYTPRGGVVVGVRRAGDALRIDVVDSGIGIPVDKQARIFTEFFQVVPANSVRGEGLGLGLAIVERLCALLGHRVSLVSRPGAGSRFGVTVPRAAPQTLAPPAPSPVALPDPFGGRRVVVIDNDPDVLDGTGGLFRSWGCEVIEASSVHRALEALEALPDTRPDLVVADFHLGEGETGVDAIARIRARFGDEVRAFVVTGDLGEAPRRAAAAAGLHVLDKPVSPMKLRALAAGILAG